MMLEPRKTKFLRQARIVALLDAVENAGIAPIPASQLHQIAYLTNALAPVWGLEPLTQELLKLYGSPYDAQLQKDLDNLTGSGLVRARDLSYFQNSQSSWRVSASYSLNYDVCESLISELSTFPDELAAIRVAKEICLAISALPPESVTSALAFDVSYSNPEFSVNSIIYLSDEGQSNASARAARLFTDASNEFDVSSSEAANLYIRHLYSLAVRSA